MAPGERGHPQRGRRLRVCPPCADEGMATSQNPDRLFLSDRSARRLSRHHPRYVQHAHRIISDQISQLAFTSRYEQNAGSPSRTQGSLEDR
jgi:hypothetical protein